MRHSTLITFIVRRMASLVVLWIAYSFLIFSLIHLAPGSPEQALVGSETLSPEVIESLRAKFHLDEPFLSQYLAWAKDAMQLDFGRSLTTSQTVVDAIEGRLEVTLLLAGMTFLLTVVLGTLGGLVAALYRGSLVDRLIVTVSLAGVSVPTFATGILLIYLFAIAIPIFHAFGAGNGTMEHVWHLVLPSITMSIAAAALLVRYTRVAMIQALEQDHVDFARARGVPRATVIVKYALRNAMVPIITASSTILAFAITGAVLVEVVFNLPGIGRLLVGAVQDKDIPLVQGVMLFIAAIVFLVNLLTDLLYMVVDPRLRQGGIVR